MFNLTAIDNTPDNAILTPLEVAALLGYTRAGILQKIKKGQIKAVQVAGKWYILGASVKALVKFN